MIKNGNLFRHKEGVRSLPANAGEQRCLNNIPLILKRAKMPWTWKISTKHFHWKCFLNDVACKLPWGNRESPPSGTSPPASPWFSTKSNPFALLSKTWHYQNCIEILGKSSKTILKIFSPKGQPLPFCEKEINPQWLKIVFLNQLGSNMDQKGLRY